MGICVDWLINYNSLLLLLTDSTAVSAYSERSSVVPAYSEHGSEVPAYSERGSAHGSIVPANLKCGSARGIVVHANFECGCARGTRRRRTRRHWSQSTMTGSELYNCQRKAFRRDNKKIDQYSGATCDERKL